MSYKDIPRKRNRKALVLAITNQKGGVGKSTASINIAATLGEEGQKVLLIDMDPQGNSTSGYGIERSKCKQCIYNALIDDVPLDEIICDTLDERVFVVPATIQLSGAELELVSSVARESRLKDAINPVENDFDFIIIDCPPSLGLLTLNALTAADALLIPIQCEYFALEGVSKLMDLMNLVKKHLNPEIDLFGVLMTMYDSRTSLSKQVVNDVETYFKGKTFKTVIPRTVKLAEAPSYGLPITKYNSSGKGARAYRELAKEVISRAER